MLRRRVLKQHHHQRFGFRNPEDTDFVRTLLPNHWEDMLIPQPARWKMRMQDLAVMIDCNHRHPTIAGVGRNRRHPTIVGRHSILAPRILHVSTGIHRHAYISSRQTNPYRVSSFSYSSYLEAYRS